MTREKARCANNTRETVVRLWKAAARPGRGPAGEGRPTRRPSCARSAPPTPRPARLDGATLPLIRLNKQTNKLASAEKIRSERHLCYHIFVYPALRIERCLFLKFGIVALVFRICGREKTNAYRVV